MVADLVIVITAIDANVRGEEEVAKDLRQDLKLPFSPSVVAVFVVMPMPKAMTATAIAITPMATTGPVAVALAVALAVSMAAVTASIKASFTASQG